MTRRNRLVALLAGLAVSTLGLGGTLAAAAETVKLSGKQTAGSVTKGARTESEDVVLESEAKITKVEGTAKEYCIWKRPGSKALMCGSSKKKLVGKTLAPGTYFVIPGLDGQRSAQVTITLEIE
jgi:hypothetical protein